MQKVYAIFGGCYSDWSVEGFFLDKERAEKYCALKNKGCDEYDKKYIIELNEINADVSDINIKWYYDVTFRLDKEWVLSKDVYDFSRKGYIGKTKSVTFEHYQLANNRNWFNVCFTAKDDTHAEKIAYDYLAQYKSLVETDGYKGAEKLMKISRP